MLKIFDFRKRMRDYVRRRLLLSVQYAMADDDIRGFALVHWDDKGRSTISWDCQYGPIRKRQIPEHVKHAIWGQIVADDTMYAVGLEREPPPDQPA